MKKLLLALLILLQPIPAHAWSEGGHHIIALMAFDLLSKDEQAKFLKTLEKHPRYKEDFEPPQKLPNDTEVTRWRVGRAGYWPDVARRQPKFHRSTWHYELGSAVTIGNVKTPNRPGQLPADATLETQALHISQAIELCRVKLRDTSPAEDKALALCWMAHLVADAHQPCHAGSLYAEGVFTEEDGDRGANRILTKQRGNMHALWDQLLGDKFTLNGTNKRMAEIREDSELVSFGVVAGLKPDPQTWLEESRAFAVASVYTSEVLNKLESVSRGLTAKPEVVDLSEAYLKKAGRVAQRRAIEAAYRLANEFRCLLHDRGFDKLFIVGRATVREDKVSVARETNQMGPPRQRDQVYTFGTNEQKNCGTGSIRRG